MDGDCARFLASIVTYNGASLLAFHLRGNVVLLAYDSRVGEFQQAAVGQSVERSSFDCLTLRDDFPKGLKELHAVLGGPETTSAGIIVTPEDRAYMAGSKGEL